MATDILLYDTNIVPVGNYTRCYNHLVGRQVDGVTLAALFDAWPQPSH
jgi:hypothetical protein